MIAKVPIISDEYYNFLIRKSGLNRIKINNTYSDLLHFLYDFPFSYSLPFDENRASDGLALRREFCRKRDVSINIFLYEFCSVFEMLVALAIRVEKEYIGDPMDEKPEYFLWEMITNLGLHGFPDGHFDEFEVQKILSNWLDRKFGWTGFGSIFPLEKTDRDQRNLDIWSQMNEYLTEKYPL